MLPVTSSKLKYLLFRHAPTRSYVLPPFHFFVLIDSVIFRTAEPRPSGPLSIKLFVTIQCHAEPIQIDNTLSNVPRL